MTQPECVVLVGLPAAGKTTFYRERFQATHEHISKDSFPNARDRNARQRRLVVDALAGGRSVVVDNTNATYADRRELVELGRAAGARLVAYYFDSTTREAIGRNQGREGKARVPIAAILATAKRLVPPGADEGFDAMYRVSVAEAGGFVVDPWPASSREASRG